MYIYAFLFFLCGVLLVIEGFNGTLGSQLFNQVLFVVATIVAILSLVAFINLFVDAICSKKHS